MTATETEGVALVASKVQHGSTVHADEASHWDKLAAYFPIKRVNHQVAYSKDGACTNQAESFFSRLRRAEVGTHHHIAGKYLGAYAAEMAWREDTNRQANGHQFAMVIGAVTAAPQSASGQGIGNVTLHRCAVRWRAKCVQKVRFKNLHEMKLQTASAKAAFRVAIILAPYLYL